MARVTVEDCIEKVPNRFDLVMLAARRSRDLSSGAPLTLDRDRDKNPVVALREIAGDTLDHAALKEGLTRRFQKQLRDDMPEEEETGPASARPDPEREEFAQDAITEDYVMDSELPADMHFEDISLPESEGDDDA